MTRVIQGLSEIAGGFEAVLVDQFGVLHDGADAFSGARECLEQLADHRVPVVALSNSGKRSHLNLARLERLGFPSALFADVVTSGELARDEIAARLADDRLAEGAAVAILSRDNDASMIEGLPVRRADAKDEAALLVIAAAEPERMSLESYREILKTHARRSVPAICANPDLKIYVEGGVGFGPGVLAELYREMGGSVLSLGKPSPAIFEAGLARLGQPAPAKVLMIGDSPTHDIAGASAVGCATLLIEGGVQAGEEASGAAAEFAMAALRW